MEGGREGKNERKTFYERGKGADPGGWNGSFAGTANKKKAFGALGKAGARRRASVGQQRKEGGESEESEVCFPLLILLKNG